MAGNTDTEVKWTGGEQMSQGHRAWCDQRCMVPLISLGFLIVRVTCLAVGAACLDR